MAFSKERSERPIDFTGVTARTPSNKTCPFCPGNEHMTPPEWLRFVNGDSWTLRVVPNKYPALRESQGGLHDVIIDSPLHARSFGLLPPETGPAVLNAAQRRFQTIGAQPAVQYIQLFKNNGPGSGASLEHPHSQILALPAVPVQVQLEWDGAHRTGACPYCRLIEEAAPSGRLIEEDAEAVVLAPFAPRFAFETWVLPRAHESHFERSQPPAVRAVGLALHRTLQRLEALFDDAPYNFLLHTAPRHSAPSACYHWHIEILPRLGGIGGFEFGTGCYINTVLPEEAAAHLRSIGTGLR